MEKLTTKASEKQVGGDHYKNTGMQPLDLIAALNLNFFQGNILKYLTRYKNKNGAQDVTKALHYAQLGREYDAQDFGERRNVDSYIDRYITANDMSEDARLCMQPIVGQDWDEIEFRCREILRKEYELEVN